MKVERRRGSEEWAEAVVSAAIRRVCPWTKAEAGTWDALGASSLDLLEIVISLEAEAGVELDISQLDIALDVSGLRAALMRAAESPAHEPAETPISRRDAL